MSEIGKMKISVKDTSVFKSLTGMVQEILTDERIDKDIREEYYRKYLDEVEEEE